MIVQNVDVCFWKLKLGFPFLLLVQQKRVQALVEFDFTYSWSCLPWSVFQQHLTSKNVLTNPTFFCLKEQRITQIFFRWTSSFVVHWTPGNLLSFWLFLALAAAPSECRTASATLVLTWKCCFSCGSYEKSFLTGLLLSIKYPCSHEDAFHSVRFPPCWWGNIFSTSWGSVKYRHWHQGDFLRLMIKVLPICCCL